MRPELDEINLTAYALGELDGSALQAVESRLAVSADDRRFVEEIRAAAQRVSQELARETPDGLDAIHHAAIELRLHTPQYPRRINRRALVRGRIGLAMSVAASVGIIGGLFVAAWIILSHQHEVASSGPTSQPTTRTVLIPLQHFNVGPLRPGHGLARIPAATDTFVNVADQKVSSFAMNPDTSSFRDVREALLLGQLPSRKSVRIEGLINAFSYQMPEPAGDADFAGQIEIGACPWRPDCRLARIAIKARAGATVVAEDATTQVTFNPEVVKSYRLLGYEDTRSGQDTGEQIVGGHAVTALYEVVPNPSANSSVELLTLSVHYHRPGSTEQEVIQFEGRRGDDANVSADFRFAAAVAEFAMALHESPDRGGATLDSVIQLAASARGSDTSGERAQFIELARRAKLLLG
jgi:hypothetical protein